MEWNLRHCKFGSRVPRSTTSAGQSPPPIILHWFRRSSPPASVCLIFRFRLVSAFVFHHHLYGVYPPSPTFNRLHCAVVAVRSRAAIAPPDWPWTCDDRLRPPPCFNRPNEQRHSCSSIGTSTRRPFGQQSLRSY
jgi:hypothetical protein